MHGATSGAWHFLEHWGPALAGDGYPVFAVDLRGHGQSEGRAALREARLDDFVADAVAAFDHVQSRTGQAPILLGHSMGAVIGRLVAARRSPRGLAAFGFGDVGMSFRAFGAWAMHNFPWATLAGMVRGDLGGLFARTEPQRRLMFGREPLESVRGFVERFRVQPESARVFPDLQGLTSVPRPQTDRILVVAGAEDPLVPVAALERLADQLDTAAIRIPGAAHDLFLGPTRHRSLDVVRDWLSRTTEVAP
ncbi:MAG: alpha/beta fold hydrolase [Myxococcota bacterium]